MQVHSGRHKSMYVLCVIRVHQFTWYYFCASKSLLNEHEIWNHGAQLVILQPIMRTHQVVLSQLPTAHTKRCNTTHTHRTPFPLCRNSPAHVVTAKPIPSATCPDMTSINLCNSWQWGNLHDSEQNSSQRCRCCEIHCKDDRALDRIVSIVNGAILIVIVRRQTPNKSRKRSE